jgi:hypothetical protein
LDRDDIESLHGRRYQRAVRLTAVPYFAGGILMCIAGALNPKGMILVLIWSCGIDLRWHVGTSVDHELAQARNADPLRTSSRTATHSQELAADGSSLCDRDGFHRCLRPEHPIGALKIWPLSFRLASRSCEPANKKRHAGTF